MFKPDSRDWHQNNISQVCHGINLQWLLIGSCIVSKIKIHLKYIFGAKRKLLKVKPDLVKLLLRYFYVDRVTEQSKEQ